MFDTCIGLLKDAIEFVAKQREKNKEKKLQISHVLEEISGVLKDTADMISQNKYPSFNCVLMEKMSNHLRYHLSDFLPQEQMDELYKTLIDASQVEKQYALREEPDTIQKIYEASAAFKSLSLFLKF